MELWIRSQDKETIMKVNRIDIDINGINIMANGFETIIGRYSKERALEVLDEIHQRLIDIQCLEIIKETTAGMKKRGRCVYIMPQE